MTFPNILPGGFPFEGILTSSEMNQIINILPQAIDGYAGGTYLNTSLITLKDLKIVGTFTFTGISVAINGIIDLNSITTVNGVSFFQNVATFNSTVNFNDNTTFIGGTNTFTGTVVVNDVSSFHDTATFFDAAIFNSVVTANSTFNVNGISTFNNAVNINGATNIAAAVNITNTLNCASTVNLRGANFIIGSTTFSNPIQFSSSGRALHTTLILPNSNSNIDVRNAQINIIDSTQTTGHTFTMIDTGALDGDELTIICNDVAHSHTINTPSNRGSTVASTYTVTFATGSKGKLTFYRAGGNWYIDPATNSF